MTPEEHADNICRWTNAGLRDLVVHEFEAAIAQEREASCKVICGRCRNNEVVTRERGPSGEVWCHGPVVCRASAIRAQP